MEKPMCAEIISIGDEITSGAILDTNAQWLSVELARLGVRVLYHSTVGDELAPMIDALTRAAQRSLLILVTGGLGPTEDDLTRQAVAEMMNVPLVFEASIFDKIRQIFERRHRTMTESNRIQACFPQGSIPIPNPFGTAPGFEVLGKTGSILSPISMDRSEPSGNCVPQPTDVPFAAPFNSESDIESALEKTSSDGDFCLMTFPGVPAELYAMWNDSGRNRTEAFLKRHGGDRHFIQTHSIHSFGLGESLVESRLPHLIDRNHVPTVGITASRGTITLRIRAESSSKEECRRQIEETRQIIMDKLSEFVYGENGQTLAETVCELLRRQQKTVGLLEWGTRGTLAQKIASDVFSGGHVFASDDLCVFPLPSCSPKFASEATSCQATASPNASPDTSLSVHAPTTKDSLLSQTLHSPSTNERAEPPFPSQFFQTLDELEPHERAEPLQKLCATFFPGRLPDFLLITGPYPLVTSAGNRSTDDLVSGCEPSKPALPVNRPGNNKLDDSELGDGVPQRASLPPTSLPSSALESSMAPRPEVCVGLIDLSTGQVLFKTTPFWEHPSLRDEVYGNRVLDLLRHLLQSPSLPKNSEIVSQSVYP